MWEAQMWKGRYAVFDIIIYRYRQDLLIFKEIFFGATGKDLDN